MSAQAQHGRRRLADLTAGLVTSCEVPDIDVSVLALHSSHVVPGAVFLATAGSRDHGLRYLEDALRRGASAVLWEPAGGVQAPPVAPGVSLVAIPQLRYRVGELAARFYGHPSARMMVIGVTGTDGKTSVTHLIAQALGVRCGVIGTLGYGMPRALAGATHTTPDPVRLHEELAHLSRGGADTVAMEVSSHALDQGRVNGVAFDLAVLTNLTRDHLDYHGDIEAYEAAKRRLFRTKGLRCALLNLDDAFGRGLADSLDSGVEVWGYAADFAGVARIPTIRATRIRTLEDGLALELVTPAGVCDLRSGLMGHFNASNLLASLGTLLMLGRPLEEALARLEGLGSVPGRMERFGGDGRPTVVVDYAHTPAALEQALRALRGHGDGRLWCVFGCGGDRDPGKRPLMGRVAGTLADRVLITDDNPRGESPAVIARDILAGVPAQTAAEVIHDRRQAIEVAMNGASPKDVVLIAGKGHEQVQIVGGEGRPFSDRDVVANLLS